MLFPEIMSTHCVIALRIIQAIIVFLALQPKKYTVIFQNLISFRDVQIFPNKLNRNFSHMSSKYSLKAGLG